MFVTLHPGPKQAGDFEGDTFNQPRLKFRESSSWSGLVDEICTVMLAGNDL